RVAHHFSGGGRDDANAARRQEKVNTRRMGINRNGDRFDTRTVITSSYRRTPIAEAMGHPVEL
ncbi:MAG: hypothetical protein KDA33_17455, partial [Phycisphaerales bacterium]|nr:hypothetical protein [Phycisphaerales bacterium]